MNSSHHASCTSEHNPSWRPALPKSLTTGGGGGGGGVCVCVCTCVYSRTVLRHHTPSWCSGTDEKSQILEDVHSMAQDHYAANHATAKHCENVRGRKVWDAGFSRSEFLLPTCRPAEVCVSEQSQNAGELSLWFLWTINNTFFLLLQIFLSINLLSWGPGLLFVVFFFFLISFCI